MNVTVKLYGTLRRFSQKGTPGLWIGVIPRNSRINDLIDLLGTKPAEVAAASINGNVRPLDTEIPDGAEIILVTFVGGG